MRLLHLLFSLEGRISRSAYWLANILRWTLAFGAFLVAAVWFVSVVGETTAGPGAAGEGDLPSQLQTWGKLPDAFHDALPRPFSLYLAAAGLAGAAFVWTGFALQVKRLHDRGKSGWWFLIGYLPFVGPLWALVECGCLPAPSGDRPAASPQGPGTGADNR